jgi:hypothetical protein
MKGIAKIPNTITKGILLLGVLIASSLCFAGSPGGWHVNLSHRFFEQDRLAPPAFINHSFVEVRHAVKVKFAAFRTRKRPILRHLQVAIAAVSIPQPVVTIKRKTAFLDSLYTLLVVYHFSSRGPPASIA